MSKWFVSGIRIRQNGEPVLQVCKHEGGADKAFIFVLYGDGSAEQHRDAYADAYTCVAALNARDNH